MREQEIEKTYNQMVTLFENLRDCLDLERDLLVATDVQGLWKTMERKKKILRGIERAGHEIKDLSKGSDLQSHGASDRPGLKMGPRLQELSRRLTNLRGEIRLRIQENVGFIQESLAFFDELISTLAGRTREAAGYQSMGRFAEGAKNSIFQRKA